jgi:hypothetical protein
MEWWNKRQELQPKWPSERQAWQVPKEETVNREERIASLKARRFEFKKRIGTLEEWAISAEFGRVAANGSII